MSFLWLTILSAFRMLRRNPLRAGLTTLGVIIGIGAVVAMVSLGQRATAAIQAEIASLGTNVLIVIPGVTTVGGFRVGLGTASTVTVDDAEDIERKVSGVTAVLYGSRSVLQVVRESKNWSTVVFGTTPLFPDMRNWPIIQGSFFTQSDLDSAAKVAVLGTTVVRNLLEPGEDVVGADLRIRNVPFHAIGVRAPRGNPSPARTKTIWSYRPFRPPNARSSGQAFWERWGSFWWRRTRKPMFRPSRTTSGIFCEPDTGCSRLMTTTLRFAPWKTSPRPSPGRVGR